jgi:hypothetical protein
MQGELDRFNRGELGAHDLSVVLDWDKRWGHDFLAYGPVFAEAARHRLPLYAANLPHGAARAYGRGGAEAVEPEHRQYLPETVIPAGEPQREELRAVFEHHAAMREKQAQGNATGDAQAASDVAEDASGVQNATDATSPMQNATDDAPATRKAAHDRPEAGEAAEADMSAGDAEPAETHPSGNGTARAPDAPAEPEAARSSDGPGAPDAPDAVDTPDAPDAEAMFERFLTVQSLWDTVMAENAVRAKAREGAPVVVLAGSGHVDFAWGIARRLERLDPGSGVLLVAPWRAHPTDTQPPEGMADVYFHCPLPPDARRMELPPMDQGQDPETEAREPESMPAPPATENGDDA